VSCVLSVPLSLRRRSVPLGITNSSASGIPMEASERGAAQHLVIAAPCSLGDCTAVIGAFLLVHGARSASHRSNRCVRCSLRPVLAGRRRSSWGSSSSSSRTPWHASEDDVRRRPTRHCTGRLDELTAERWLQGSATWRIGARRQGWRVRRGVSAEARWKTKRFDQSPSSPGSMLTSHCMLCL
jgi:hypothetical protein